MRVGFYVADQNPHRDRTRGISLYTERLIQHLQDGRLDLGVVASRSSIQLPQITPRAVLPWRTDHMMGRICADQGHPFWRLFPADVWHYPKGFLPFAGRPHFPVIGTVHDVILDFYIRQYPQYRSSASYTYWRMMLNSAISRFHHVITVSSVSKNEIRKYCDRHRLVCPPITVIYHGFDWDEVQEPERKEDFVLHLASPLPHKGTNLLLQCWQDLRGRVKDLPLLKLVGQLDAKGHELMTGLPGVEVLPSLPWRPLMSVMQRARALILPSEIEGFGLPALEAYAVGTPVMYRRGTAVEEVLGAAVGSFEWPIDSLQQAFESVLGMRETQIAAIRERLRNQFSWTACAAETRAVYESVT